MRDPGEFVLVWSAAPDEEGEVVTDKAAPTSPAPAFNILRLSNGTTDESDDAEMTRQRIDTVLIKALPVGRTVDAILWMYLRLPFHWTTYQVFRDEQNTYRISTVCT